MAHRKTGGVSPLRTALFYAGIAALYVVVSDRLVLHIADSLPAEAWLQSFKGILFVVVTAGVLYWLLAREFRRKDRLHALLAAKEARERAILETAQEGIWTVDDSGRTLYTNDALSQMLGYGQEEMVGVSAFDFVAEPDRDAARQRFFRRELGRPAEHVELRFSKKDGTVLWGLLSLTPVFDGAGRLERIIGFLVDISDRKAHEEHLARSLKEKEVLLQEIHHRVKNNLQVISSFLNLQMHYLPPGQDARHLRASQNRVRAMALVHERLYQNAEAHEVEMNGYLSDLVAAVRALVDTNDGRIQVELDAAAITLDIARAVPIGLIVNELVSNSFEHAYGPGDAGTIRVTMDERSDGVILLTIADDGRGGKAAEVEESDSLGIHIVRALADQLQARLSWHVDQGVTAVVEIPPLSQSS